MNKLLARVATMVVVSVIVCSACVAADSATMTLLDKSSEPPEIFVSAYASASEALAARELRDYLEKLTGRSITIRTDYWIKGNPTGTFIAVGKCRFNDDLEISGLATEQYIIDVTAHRVAIVGGRDRRRGVLYGVFDLLEQLGVRWYRPEPWGEHVPKLDNIRLPLGRKTAKPPDYSYRSVLGGGFMRNAECTLDQNEWGSLWALRNRMNGPDPGSDPRFGGQVALSFDHIYYQLIPVEEYFDAHPEYFCLYKGQRRRTNPDGSGRPGNPTGLQLCLSNRDLQQLFADKIVARAKGRTDLDSVSFSMTPNDACPFCECDQCKAMDDQRDPDSMSNRVCAFTNIVAKQLAAAVPGARVSLNAYSTWTAPPTIVARMEPNVLIHIALINDWSDYTKPLMSVETNWNNRTVKSLARWKELGAAEIYTYEYWSGYGWPGPLPLVRTMADRIRAYRQFHVRGIYNETAPSWGPQGLELYMYTKLIANPDLDVDQELDLYYSNYYGPAARPMKAYHEQLMHALETSPTPVFSGGRGMHLVMTPKLIRALDAQLAEAKSLVNGQPLYERRLKGVVAGHEFASRVVAILQMKKQDGVRTPIAGGDGSFLKSDKAERAFPDVYQLFRRSVRDDAIFDVGEQTPILPYTDGDVLRNDAFGYRNEADYLSEF